MKLLPENFARCSSTLMIRLHVVIGELYNTILYNNIIINNIILLVWLLLYLSIEALETVAATYLYYVYIIIHIFIYRWYELIATNEPIYNECLYFLHFFFLSSLPDSGHYFSRTWLAFRKFSSIQHAVIRRRCI